MQFVAQFEVEKSTVKAGKLQNSQDQGQYILVLAFACRLLSVAFIMDQLLTGLFSQR